MYKLILQVPNFETNIKHMFKEPGLSDCMDS